MYARYCKVAGTLHNNVHQHGGCAEGCIRLGEKGGGGCCVVRAQGETHCRDRD